MKISEFQTLLKPVTDLIAAGTVDAALGEELHRRFPADGETFEEWMTNLRPHYMEAHADVMSDSSKTKEDMESWMAENRARFDAV